MSALPDEVLLKVFSLLGTEDLVLVSQVSRAWSRVARDFTIWRQVRLTVQNFPNTTNVERYVNSVVGKTGGSYLNTNTSISCSSK